MNKTKKDKDQSDATNIAVKSTADVTKPQQIKRRAVNVVLDVGYFV